MIGFKALKARLLNDFANQKLHHSILLHGQRGSGKSGFLHEFCQEILNNKASELSDIRIVSLADGKKSISVKEIRDCEDFLNQSSAVSQYKLLIIDSACELSASAANALLKPLEEPKPNNFIFLVAHNLSQVLPTIRSRCMLIRAPQLQKNDFLAVLKDHGCNFSKSESDFLSEICNYAPAQAIQNGSELIGLYRQILNSATDQKAYCDLLKKLSDKKLSFSLFEKVQSLFIFRLISAKIYISRNQLNSFQFFFDEFEVFRNYFISRCDDSESFENRSAGVFGHTSSNGSAEILARRSSQIEDTEQFLRNLCVEQSLESLIEKFEINANHCKMANSLNLDKKIAAISCIHNLLKI